MPDSVASSGVERMSQRVHRAGPVGPCVMSAFADEFAAAAWQSACAVDYRAVPATTISACCGVVRRCTPRRDCSTQLGSAAGVINVPICAGLNGGRGAAAGQPKYRLAAVPQMRPWQAPMPQRVCSLASRQFAQRAHFADAHVFAAAQQAWRRRAACGRRPARRRLVRRAGEAPPARAERSTGCSALRRAESGRGTLARSHRLQLWPPRRCHDPRSRLPRRASSTPPMPVHSPAASTPSTEVRCSSSTTIAPAAPIAQPSAYASVIFGTRPIATGDAIAIERDRRCWPRRIGHALDAALALRAARPRCRSSSAIRRTRASC